MKFFNAKIIINYSSALEAPGEYEISANIIDNSGIFFASDVKVGDIMYLNGSIVGELLLRYKVKEIKEATGSTLSAVVQWDIQDEEAKEPYGSTEGIIGEVINEFGASMIGSIFINSCDESVVSAARSYEQKLISSSLKDINGKIKFPSLGYSLVEE